MKKILQNIEDIMVHIFTPKKKEEPKVQTKEPVKNTPKYINPDFTSGSVRVVEIDETAKTINEGLGITEKRCEEIAKVVFESEKKETNIVKIMECVSLECKHPNELAFAIYVLARNQSRQDNPFLQIIEHHRRRQRPDQE